jgi:dTDP-4-amino-4,6-dideoxygalactose transaminase
MPTNTDRPALLGGTPVRREPLPNPNRAVGPRAGEYLQEILTTGHMMRVGGQFVERLEREFAALYGVAHCTASSSGTAALHTALGALRLEPGDEVITAPITDMGTIIPIVAQNAIPVFADVRRDTLNLDSDDVEHRITPRTRALLPVHLGGNPCDMTRLVEIARRHGLAVIEDCSQAYCASHQGRWVGTFGDLGCFSMQQSKHLTCGQGGLTVTADEELARRIAIFPHKGGPHYSAVGARDYLTFGFNYHLTELQAAVALSQLPDLPALVARRTRNGERLTELLAGLPGIHPQRVAPGDHSTYWMYAVRAVEAETGLPAARFAEALRAEGIACGYQYIGKPIFLYEALRRKQVYGTSHYPFDLQDAAHAVRYEEGACPQCEAALDEMLVVPLHEVFGEAELNDIAAAFHKVAGADWS